MGKYYVVCSNEEKLALTEANVLKALNGDKQVLIFNDEEAAKRYCELRAKPHYQHEPHAVSNHEFSSNILLQERTDGFVLTVEDLDMNLTSPVWIPISYDKPVPFQRKTFTLTQKPDTKYISIVIEGVDKCWYISFTHDFDSYLLDSVDVFKTFQPILDQDELFIIEGEMDEELKNSDNKFILSNEFSSRAAPGQLFVQNDTPIKIKGRFATANRFLSLIRAQRADNSEKIDFSPSLRKYTLLKEYVATFDDPKKNDLVRLLKPSELHQLFSALRKEPNITEKDINKAEKRLISAFVNRAEVIERRWFYADIFTLFAARIIRKLFFSPKEENFIQTKLTSDQRELYDKGHKGHIVIKPLSMKKTVKEVSKIVAVDTDSEQPFVKGTYYQNQRFIVYMNHGKKLKELEAKLKQCNEELAKHSLQENKKPLENKKKKIEDAIINLNLKTQERLSKSKEKSQTIVQKSDFRPTKR